MLPIAELVRVSRLVDDSWHCELAKRAAARWNLQEAVFVRSSASHVFVARRPEGGPRVVLRMRPESPSHCPALHRSARAAERLSGAGAPVVAAVRSTAGRLVEVVDKYCVTAVAVAEGESRDDEEADQTTAHAWGAALAQLHASGAVLDDVPDMVDLCAPGAAPLSGEQPMDDRVRLVAAEIAADLAALPRDSAVHGLLHGDAEIDNVVFTATGPVFVDLDDVRMGWWAADIAFALRAWGPIGRAPDLAAEVPAAFLAGYRVHRPLTDEELTWLPLFARAAALESLGELQPLLGHPADPSWPPWATTLDARIRTRADDLSAALA
jgi:Ser/Thr protein kinase RdoA (MazF antagonist)